MNSKQQLAEFAALCIEALDAHSGQPLTILEISRTKGIPLTTCMDIVCRLSHAGIVRLEADQATLVRDDVTVLEVLQAMWSRRTKQSMPAVSMLDCFAGDLQVQKTWEFVSRSLIAGTEGING